MQSRPRTRTVATAVVTVLALTCLNTALLGRGTGLATAIAGMATALLLGWVVMRTGEHTPWAQAQSELSNGRAVVFWKPGCGYCERLRLGMRGDDRVVWVNVWEDDDANAKVRSLNAGNELTPTALVGEDVLVNPRTEDLRAALDARG